MDANAKIDLVLVELKRIFNQIDERFDRVDKRFEQIDARFEQIENRLDNMDKRFEQIENRLDNMDKKIEQIENRLDNMDKKSEEVDKKINDLSTEMGAFNRTLFKLDVDTRENFHTLSDAIKAHTDKEILFEKQLYRLSDQVDNTTFRVSILEDTLVNS